MYSSTLPTFPSNILVAQNTLWYSSSTVQLVISTINNVYFPIAEDRSQAFDVIVGVVTQVPFSYIPPSRFNSPGVYISTLDPLLNRILSQLLSALSYKDRLIEKTNIGNFTNSTTSNSPQYIAALNSFTSARLALIDYTSDYRNYYDRFTFETNYSLTWS